MHKLEKRCRQHLDCFASLGDTTYTPDGPLTYIDNGSDILAVAHLDYVDWTIPRWSRRRRTIYCPQLDDRLGVHMILDRLPEFGVNVDILLTDSEEIGRSTAQYFKPPKDYNWMFQFDRAGLDCVLYEYDNRETRAQLAQHGWSTSYGAFSDICYLNDLECIGINFGCGYHDQHSRYCYAQLIDIETSLERAASFYHRFRDTPMPWDDWEYTGAVFRRTKDAPRLEYFADDDETEGIMFDDCQWCGGWKPLCDCEGIAHQMGWS
jgi:hypothetical protein